VHRPSALHESPVGRVSNESAAPRARKSFLNVSFPERGIILPPAGAVPHFEVESTQNWIPLKLHSVKSNATTTAGIGCLVPRLYAAQIKHAPPVNYY